MLIGGLQKTTLIDYPEKIAAIVFTAGCNMNCHYCYNPTLRNFSPTIMEEDFFSFLDTRKNILDAITICGGEPTQQGDLVSFVQKIKQRGFLVKLDTQGTNPHVLRILLEEKLIDYIAMDIKAPLSKYREVANCFIDKKAIKKSIELIIEQAPDYEFRTTIVKGQLTITDMKKIGELIAGAKRHYSQKFVKTKQLNDQKFMLKESFSDAEMESIRSLMSHHVKEAYVR